MGPFAAHKQNILPAVGLDNGLSLTVLNFSFIGHMH
jgi:hypothetical protein